MYDFNIQEPGNKIERSAERYCVQKKSAAALKHTK